MKKREKSESPSKQKNDAESAGGSTLTSPLPSSQSIDTHQWDSTTSRPILTFFELTTLIAAKIFEHCEVDTAIYEIGLGGRLDAVNALQPPDLALFATMGFDHQLYLGDTIPLITGEKAAILS